MSIFGVNYAFKTELVNSPSIVLTQATLGELKGEWFRVCVSPISLSYEACVRVCRSTVQETHYNVYFKCFDNIQTAWQHTYSKKKTQEVRCVHSAITAKSRLHFFDRMHNIHKHLWKWFG